MIEFFDEHVISTFIIYFIKSSPHKSSGMYYNICNIYNVSSFLIRQSKNECRGTL